MPDKKPRSKPVLPPRSYIYSVMMARSHELTHHNGKRCTCPPKKPTPKTD